MNTAYLQNLQLIPAREIQKGDIVLIAGSKTRVEGIHELDSGAIVFDVKIERKNRAKTYRPLQLLEKIQ